VLTISDQLLFILKYFFYKTTYLNEVNCTEPSPSARVPWINLYIPWLVLKSSDTVVNSKSVVNICLISLLNVAENNCIKTEETFETCTNYQ
jgi:hypothetical protein